MTKNIRFARGLKKALVIAVIAVAAVLSLASPASAGYQVERVYGNSKIATMGIGPRWIAWTERGGWCVKAAHLDVPNSTRAVFCQGVDDFGDVAVGTGHIAAAFTSGSTHRIYVHNIDTGAKSYITTANHASHLRMDGTRLAWQDGGRVNHVNLGETPWSPQLVTSAGGYPDISGDVAVFYSNGNTHARRLSGTSWLVGTGGRGLARISGPKIIFPKEPCDKYNVAYTDGRPSSVVAMDRIGLCMGFDFDGDVLARITDVRGRSTLDIPGRAPNADSLTRPYRFTHVEVSAGRIAVRYKCDPAFGTCPSDPPSYLAVGRVS